MTPASPGPNRVRVAALDVEHSQRWTTVLVGPLELPPRTQLLDRYTALVERSALARLCLEPSLNSRRWRQVPVDASQVITAVDAPPAGDPSTALVPLVRAMRTSDTAGGVRILCAGDQLAIDFCHGLGEVALVHLILDVLLGAVDPRDPDLLAPYRNRLPPLLHAGLHTFGTSPRRVAAALQEYRLRATRSAGRVDHPDPGAHNPFRPAATTRVAGLSAAAVAELRERRDASLPGVSLVALSTHALWEALTGTGMAMDDSVTIPFDVRRYLPTGTSTLSPFTAGLDYTLGSGGPARLQAEMDRSARSGRPVANLLMGTLKSRLGQHETAGAHPVRPRMRLLHSNVGTPEHSGRWPFIDPRSAYMLVASDPAGPEGVTVTSAAMSGNLWLTAEFHGSVFEPDRIATALNTVGDRMYEMTSAGHSRLAACQNRPLPR